ncbi:hypothetical protein VNO78_18996 [Psophocarpus tetragonolobus]|uniref:Uncharacterized protein n=1 Tax=Psophocarpus tetragonolobus TaxID=3891 RepID=A0AAN9S8B9_PSOTE
MLFGRFWMSVLGVERSYGGCWALKLLQNVLLSEHDSLDDVGGFIEVVGETVEQVMVVMGGWERGGEVESINCLLSLKLPLTAVVVVALAHTHASALSRSRSRSRSRLVSLSLTLALAQSHAHSISLQLFVHVTWISVYSRLETLDKEEVVKSKDSEKLDIANDITVVD